MQLSQHQTEIDMNDTLKALADTATATTEPSTVINGKTVCVTLVPTYRGSKRKPVTMWKVNGKRVAAKDLMAALKN
jgi:hypothetical protein